MKHKRWWCNVIYTKDCAPCRVRHLTYGYRMEPYGYIEARNAVFNDQLLTIEERLWVISHTRSIKVED